ncbi:hypothetical protein D3C81_1906410 [compost metagenome]
MTDRQLLGSVFVFKGNLDRTYNRLIVLAPAMIAVYSKLQRKALQLRAHFLAGQVTAFTKYERERCDLRAGHPLCPNRV